MSSLVFIIAALIGCSSGLKFIAIGDWGDDNEDQYKVAAAMSSWCGSHQCDFIFSMGDNFYPDGVFSADDARFNTTWRWVYDLPNIDTLTWYVTIGNHDYGIRDDRELYQVEFSETEPRWVVPWLWYDFTVVEDDATIQFFVIDTTGLISRKNDPDLQLQWLNDTLEASTADWKIVVGHAPPYCAGGHAPSTQTLVNYVVPVCEAYGVDAFFSGDDHNLEHITEIVDPNIDYVITGAGGRGLYEFSLVGDEILNEWGLTVNYFQAVHGFAYVEFTKTTMKVDLVNYLNEVAYSFTREK